MQTGDPAFVDASAPYRPAGSLNAATALLAYSGPWNAQLAAHLLRRAGFGGSPADVDRIGRMPLRDAVDSLVHFGPTPGLADGPADMPDWDQYRALLRQVNAGRLSPSAVFQNQYGMQQMDEQPAAGEAAQQGEAMTGAPTIGQARAHLAKQYAAPSLIAMQRWWLERMLLTPSPLQEKMTLLWHGHFTSEMLDKGTSPPEMLAQNQLFRRFALGNVRDLTQAVARDPAMLRYLDNARSERAHPNENFARELMELFTLGIGNYTEQDIRESARAFTGWSIRDDQFYENGRAHDDGQKSFLGRNGNFDGNDIINIIFQQPAAGRWFARKLLVNFVYSDPEPELVEATAALIRKNDFNLQPVVSTLLRSNVFFSPRAYRALVKSPVEFVVGAHQLYGAKKISIESLSALRRMGQFLYRPPNVKGWDGGVAWLNSQTLLTRENFASMLVTSPMLPADSWLSQGMPASARDAASRIVATVLQGDASPASMQRLVGYLDGNDTSANGAFSGENFPERIRGAAYLAMAMPAYQLA
jgi:uncharacterized protein (DUF1800 family)